MQKAEGLSHHRGVQNLSYHSLFFFNLFEFVAQVQQLVVLFSFFLPVLWETFAPEQHANGGTRRPQHTQHARWLQPLGRVQEIGQCAEG